MGDVTPKAVVLLGTDSGGFPSPLRLEPSIPIQVPGSVTATDLVVISQTFGFDPNNNAWAGVENQQTAADGNLGSTTNNLLGVVGNTYAWNNHAGTWDRVRINETDIDGLPQVLTGNLQTISQAYGFNGTSFDRVRIATVFHSVLATAAGNTPVWTPSSSTRFRLMGYTISVAGTLAATGVELIKLTDAAAGTVIAQHQATVTITTPTGDTQIGADLGQGFLSRAANNILEVNLSAAMATGGVAVNVWGTEE